MLRRTISNSLFILLLTISITIYSQDITQGELPKGAIARLGKGGINLIRFSPDGSKLAVGTDIGLWLYDVKEGPLSGKFSGGFNQVNVLAFSPDGSLLASGGIDNPEIQIMTTGNNKKHSSYNISEDSITLLGITFHDNLIISLNNTSGLIHFKTNGEKKFKFPLQSKYELAVFSPDAELLASGSDDGTVLLWDWEKIVGRIKEGKL